MAIDPKAQAARAQDAAAQAKAAAKAAAVAAAKAEAKAEAQAPPAVVQTAVAASTIAPLDVFTAATGAPAAQKSDTGQRDLSSDQERMAEASGAGRSSARNPGKPGETADPDLASIGRPGGHKGPSGPSSGENPFGDRAAALRDTPAAAENPMDSFGKIDNAGDRLREATGRDDGLGGAAERLSPFAQNPAAPQNPGFGKSSIASAPDPALAAALAEAAKIPATTMPQPESPDGGTPDGGTPDAGPTTGKGIWQDNEVKATTPPEPSMWDRFVKVFTREVTADGVTPTGEAMRQAVDEIDSMGPSKAPADAGTPAGPDGGTKPVQDPGMEGETKLPPGWIDGDAILPPSLRTGANVGGAKGNDGVDWAHSRRAATNPSREDTGGGGGKETYIQREGKNSLISQPERDDGAGGGGSNGTPSSGTPQNSGGSTDPLDGSAWTGPTRTDDPGPVNTTSSEGVMAAAWNDANDDDDDDSGSRD
jgi:hypothetical protein